MPTIPSTSPDLLDAVSGDAMSEAVVDNIRQALRGLQFGEITITVRNGSVIQIDRIARKRQFKTHLRDDISSR